MIRSLIAQKWCPFSVLADNGTFLSDTPVLAKQFGSSNE